jgi:Na+/melibiose symporter-like transporter
LNFPKKIELRNKKFKSADVNIKVNQFDNQNEKSSENEKVIKKENTQPAEPVLKVLFSFGFISVFLVSGFKICTNFIYAGCFKDYGIYFLKDDQFSSTMALIGTFFNITVRIFMGKITDSLGFHLTYIINLTFEFLVPFLFYFYGTHKIAFAIALFILRSSSGSV